MAATGSWCLAVVKLSNAHKFIVLPKRWIVEGTLAWISRNRRLMRDFERYARTVEAFVRLAVIRIMPKKANTHKQLFVSPIFSDRLLGFHRSALVPSDPRFAEMAVSRRCGNAGHRASIALIASESLDRT